MPGGNSRGLLRRSVDREMRIQSLSDFMAEDWARQLNALPEEAELSHLNNELRRRCGHSKQHERLQLLAKHIQAQQKQKSSIDNHISPASLQAQPQP